MKKINKKVKLALIGNPNVGKSTLFNSLTGLNQQTGNYPGITVEKKSGDFSHKGTDYEIIDFPGIYSLYPNSTDEELTIDVISDKKHVDHPDIAIVLLDAANLKRSLLLLSQVQELKIPTVVGLNFLPEAKKKGNQIHLDFLESFVDAPVVALNAKNGKGVEKLKEQFKNASIDHPNEFKIPEKQQAATKEIKEYFKLSSDYLAWHMLSSGNAENLTPEMFSFLTQTREKHNIVGKRLQVKETIDRYSMVDNVWDKLITHTPTEKERWSKKVDNLVTHPFLGYIVFATILMFAFQLLFNFSSIPMDLIDGSFSWLSETLQDILPKGILNQIITDAIIPGIAGIVIFIPQIMILFFFLFMMEQSGYMSRVVFLMDRWMRPFGLSGKSVVPLMSGVACAVPAIMSSRNIENPKDRLITILVTPFMTCSARLPVYSVIIALVIPDSKFLGLNLQGIILFGMYVLGVIVALVSGLFLKKFIEKPYKGYLLMEMPNYRFPNLIDIIKSVYFKVKDFVFEAGKIIFALSILLWVAANISFTTSREKIEQRLISENTIQAEELESSVNAEFLENSILGVTGKTLAPIFRPIGYDWKITIGILASFAAREVFVSTMASIYNIADGGEDEQTIREHMEKEVHAENSKPVYTLGTGLSLLMFYAFAMQCISTLAVVKRETLNWHWPIFQFIFMTGFAYLMSFIVYQIFK